MDNNLKKKTVHKYYVKILTKIKKLGILGYYILKCNNTNFVWPTVTLKLKSLKRTSFLIISNGILEVRKSPKEILIMFIMSMLLYIYHRSTLSQIKRKAIIIDRLLSSFLPTNRKSANGY